MGLTQLTVRIASPTDPNRYRDLECIVDSGATFTVVPKRILEQLDIKPRSSRTFILANGEKFERSLGNAEVEYKGARGAASVFSAKKATFRCSVSHRWKRWG